MAFDESGRDDLLDRLVEEFADRLRRGERPALKEFTDRYPELADEVRGLFPAMAQVERAKEIRQDWDEAERADAAPPPPEQVGDYRIVREIGRGGHGDRLRGRAGRTRPPGGPEGPADAVGAGRHDAGPVPPRGPRLGPAASHQQ